MPEVEDARRHVVPYNYLTH